MHGRLLKIGAAATAIALLAGALLIANAGRSPSSVDRPARALAPKGTGEGVDADVDAPVGGAPAVPVVAGGTVPTSSARLREVVSTELRVMPWVKRELSREADADEDETEEAKPALERAPIEVNQTDGALQIEGGTARMPAPTLSFNGLGVGANGYKVVPPDTNGDVGNGYFVQMVNSVLAVYDADTGSKLSGPTLLSNLFNRSSQRLCATHDDGDPIVVYDENAGAGGRWILTQFALNINAGTFAQCIAVSKTANPRGAYWAYQFSYPKAGVLNDYPKFGVWNDGYYASFNQFRCGSARCDFAWRGAGTIAYDRDAMLMGEPARQIYFDLFAVDPNLGSLLPADADGTAPPAGTPSFFTQFDPDEWGYPDDQLEVWEFHTDWAVPDNSTFEQQGLLPTADFNPSICGLDRTNCVAQKGSATKLDTLSDRLMFRLQYRNLGGGDERMVVTSSVRAAAGIAGIRWYQLASSAGADWTIADQGTYAPDTSKSRWMGSAAMDADGNMAVGYSLAGSAIHPSIGIAGRMNGDPAGQLTQAERKVFAGPGSEKGGYNRWGDYADLTVDTDGCTFFFTTEYYKKTNQWSWATRIVTFALPECGP